MPFRDVNTSAFGPDDLDILTAAFNAAWEQLATKMAGSPVRIRSSLKSAWRRVFWLAPRLASLTEPN